ncbi:MAG: hypothetical protein U0441_04890 [Polyangiaceae bacterium]
MARSTVRRENENKGGLSQMAKRALEDTVPANNSSGYIDFRSILHSTEWRALTAQSRGADPPPSMGRTHNSHSDAPVSMDSPPSGAVAASDPVDDDAAPDTERDPETLRNGAPRSRTRAWMQLVPGLSAGGFVGAVTALLVASLTQPPAATAPAGLGDKASPQAVDATAAQATSIGPAAAQATSIEGASRARAAAPEPTPQPLQGEAGPAATILAPARVSPTSTAVSGARNSKSFPRPSLAKTKAAATAAGQAGDAPAAPKPGVAPKSSADALESPPPTHEAAHKIAVDPCNGDLMCAMKRAVGEK